MIPHLPVLAWTALLGASPAPFRDTTPQTSSPPLDTTAVRLTTDILANLMTFCTAYKQVPEKIRTAAEESESHTVLLGDGTSTATITDDNIKAMAAQVPAIAAALSHAHLTGSQFDMDRAALWIAGQTQIAGVKPVASSLTAQNIVFLQAHSKALTELRSNCMSYVFIP